MHPPAMQAVHRPAQRNIFRHRTEPRTLCAKTLRQIRLTRILMRNLAASRHPLCMPLRRHRKRVVPCQGSQSDSNAFLIHKFKKIARAILAQPRRVRRTGRIRAQTQTNQKYTREQQGTRSRYTDSQSDFLLSASATDLPNPIPLQQFRACPTLWVPRFAELTWGSSLAHRRTQNLRCDTLLPTCTPPGAHKSSS